MRTIANQHRRVAAVQRHIQRRNDEHWHLRSVLAHDKHLATKREVIRPCAWSLPTQSSSRGTLRYMTYAATLLSRHVSVLRGAQTPCHCEPLLLPTMILTGFALHVRLLLCK